MAGEQTAKEKKVVQGINPRQLEAFNKQYAALPEKFTLGLTKAECSASTRPAVRVDFQLERLERMRLRQPVTPPVNV